MSRGRPLVLCYHAITDTWPHPLAVGPAAFAAQLRWLVRRGFRPVRGAELLTSGGRALHVTFDDAFRSVLAALPTLEGLQIPATVFACPWFADGGRPLAVPELEGALAEFGAELDTLPWDGLRELVSRGVTIGSHSVSHPHLTRLSDRELSVELRESRQQIEDELRRPCRLLAYPYGEYDARVAAAAQAAGYEAAFALSGSERRPGRYAVPRIGIWHGDDGLRVLLKTSPLRDGLAQTRRLLSRHP